MTDWWIGGTTGRVLGREPGGLGGASGRSGLGHGCSLSAADSNLSIFACTQMRNHAGQCPAREQVDLAVEVFRMLSDATRVQLLWALLDGEMPVNELADAVGKPATGVSQHLAKLRMARLVTTRRQANQIFYRVDSAHVRQLVEDAIYQAEHAAGGIPEHHRSRRRSRTSPRPRSPTRPRERQPTTRADQEGAMTNTQHAHDHPHDRPGHDQPGHATTRTSPDTTTVMATGTRPRARSPRRVPGQAQGDLRPALARQR